MNTVDDRFMKPTKLGTLLEQCPSLSNSLDEFQCVVISLNNSIQTSGPSYRDLRLENKWGATTNTFSLLRKIH